MFPFKTVFQFKTVISSRLCFCTVSFCWLEVAFKVRQSIVDKVQDQRASEDVTAADLDGMNVIPLLCAERVIDHRVAEDKSHLGFCHTRLESVEHLLGDHVALLNGNAVNARKAKRRACGKAGNDADK